MRVLPAAFKSGAFESGSFKSGAFLSRSKKCCQLRRRSPASASHLTAAGQCCPSPQNPVFRNPDCVAHRVRLHASASRRLRLPLNAYALRPGPLNRSPPNRPPNRFQIILGKTCLEKVTGKPNLEKRDRIERNFSRAGFEPHPCGQCLAARGIPARFPIRCFTLSGKFLDRTLRKSGFSVSIHSFGATLPNRDATAVALRW